MLSQEDFGFLTVCVIVLVHGLGKVYPRGDKNYIGVDSLMQCIENPQMSWMAHMQRMNQRRECGRRKCTNAEKEVDPERLGMG